MTEAKVSKCKPIKTESNDEFMTDTDKVILEIACEKLMEDLDALFKRMGSRQKNSTYLDSYEPKKELLKSLIFSNEQRSEIQLKQIENLIVRVIFTDLVLKTFFSPSFIYLFFDFRITFLIKQNQISQ